MADRTFKAKGRKVAPIKDVRNDEKKVVLVGTYRKGQLERWPGWYNYPISAKDKIDEQAAKRVTELWLFRGKDDGRYFAAEFVGVKTRAELVRDFGYKAQGKAHGEKYLLYKLGATLYEPVPGFSEINGFHLAMHKLGGKCVFACEWDNPFKVTVCDLKHRVTQLHEYRRCG